MGCIHVTRDTFEEVRAGTSKNFSHLYRTTECSHVSRLDILMTTKDFKGRCYMRGHPRICLNMLGTHLMAVPNICQKKRHHAFCGLTFWELTFWEEPVTQLKQLKACKCKNDVSAKLYSNSSHFHYMKPAVGKQLN